MIRERSQVPKGPHALDIALLQYSLMTSKFQKALDFVLFMYIHNLSALGRVSLIQWSKYTVDAIPGISSPLSFPCLKMSEFEGNLEIHEFSTCALSVRKL